MKSNFQFLFLLLLCLSLPASIFAPGSDNSSVASVHFSLDDCNPHMVNGSTGPYAEFTGEVSNSGLATIEVLNENLYRANSDVNKHSCTPGVDGTAGMCISFDKSCNFEAGNEMSLVIDLLVTPSGNQAVYLSELCLVVVDAIVYAIEYPA